jgi:hypothetical protein
MPFVKKIQPLILFCFLFSASSFLQAQKLIRYTEDTAKVAIGLTAKAGIMYDYPFFYNYTDPSPVGELGFNVILDKIQIGTGLGLFANNSHWRQGGDGINPEKNGTTETANFFIPLHVNLKLFNLKRNLFSMKFGFIFLLSTPASIRETSIYGTQTYVINQTRFGLGGTLGFKYSRHIGEKILLGAELSLNLSLTPSPAMLLGTDYVYGFNMISRQPNGDFKICFEYILGKKHVNYLDLSKKKPKKTKVDDSIIDEE